jgi:bacteriochlorophyllide a dehydrogenase
MPHLARHGEITLAGFYHAPVAFAFPPAFMKEARIRIAAEWTRPDMDAVRELIAAGQLKLDGLITHHATAADAVEAYRTAFSNPDCLKMILDWRQVQ